MNEMNEVRKPPVATTGIIGWLRINSVSYTHLTLPTNREV